MVGRMREAAAGERRQLSKSEEIVVNAMREGVEYIHRQDFDAALSELRQERAENEQLRGLLQLCHTGSRDHVICSRGGIGCSVDHAWVADQVES